MKTHSYIFVFFFLFGISLQGFSQLKVLPNGRACIGPSNLVSTSSNLNVKAVDNTAIYANLNYTGNTYPENIKSTVNNANGFTFAGYFNNSRTFFVSAQGWIYSQGQYIGSDENLKKNVENLDNSLGKLLQIRGVRYEYKEGADSASGNGENRARTGKSGQKHIGVVAQEIEEVFPELVKTMEDGTKAVAYAELSGVFIEAFKEQQELIEEQTKRLEELEVRLQALEGLLTPANMASPSSTGIGNTPENTAEVQAVKRNRKSYLYQNTPNPFGNETTIKFFVDDKTNSAMLLLFDLQGSLLKQYPISQRGEGQIRLSAGELKAGQYIYSLFENGTETDSKKMVVISK